MRTLAAVMMVAALAACSSDAEAVPWDNYAPVVRERVEALADAGDCAGLQAEFDAADANDDTQRARAGEGNAALMAYLDDAMRDAGCY